MSLLLPLPTLAAPTPAIAPAAPVLKDTEPPTGTIVINGGAALTNSAVVTLTLSATDNSGTVSQMRFSNDGSTYSPPIPYATTASWQLAPGDGTKTVYAKFSDPSGNWSQPATDTIILDTTQPIVTITFPSDGQVFGAQ